MRFRSWSFDLEDGPHRVELQHGWWSGHRIIRVDGRVLEQTPLLRHLIDFGSTHGFDIGDHDCQLRIRAIGLDWGFSYSLIIDGKKVGSIHKGTLPQKCNVEIKEEGYLEEPIGQETREIDNSKSTATITRRLSITKEWNQSHAIDSENINKVAMSSEGGAKSILSLKVAAEEELRQKYSVSRQIKQSQTEEITIEVPPQRKVIMCFKWKRIVRTGIILLSDLQQSVSLPFQIVVGVTFDQAQQDA